MIQRYSFICMCVLIVGWPTHRALADTLRYDGIYCSVDSSAGYAYYLRFYADGLVLSVTSTGTPAQVIRWFRREDPAASRGKYVVKKQRIRFTTFGFEWELRCAGEMRENALFMKCRAPGTYRYDFLPLHHIR